MQRRSRDSSLTRPGAIAARPAAVGARPAMASVIRPGGVGAVVTKAGRHRDNRRNEAMPMVVIFFDVMVA